MKGSTPKLSDVAAQLVIPSGIVTTAWPSVKAECARLGIEFDPWQDGAGRIAFGKRADGSFAATVGGIVFSIPRQVGKTFFLGAVVFALCMLNPGTLVIWTAHQLPTAGETFRSMQAMARQPKVRGFIKQIRVGSGDQVIEFTNGSRIMFGARERGFGLGFTKVGVLILDEGQRLTEKTMDDLVPTLNQGKNPLMFIVGTPPRPTDSGEEFKTRRRKAFEVQRRRSAGEDPENNMMYLEFGADRSIRPELWKPGYVDWEAIAQANPSYPKRTPKTAVKRMLENLRPESIRREALGIWDDDQEGSRQITETEWAASGIDVAPTEGLRVFSVAFNLDGTALSLGAGLKHAAGVHVELIDAASGDLATGLGQLADWLAARWRIAAQIVLSGAAGAPVLAQLLKDRGVPDAVVKIANTLEYTTACSSTLNAVREAAKVSAENKNLEDEESPEPLPFTHLASDGQAVLDSSVAISDKKKRGNSGAWGWIATTEDGDETPLEAVSLAYWLASTTKRKPYGEQERRAKFL